MTRVFENKTIDEIRVGDSAAITRTLHSADLRALAAVSGNPCLDEDFIAGHGVTQWAASLFSTVIGSKLPGPGSVIQSVSARFHRPIRTGEAVDATVTVKEIRKDQGIVLLDCRCTDGAGNMIAEASFEASAPAVKIRKELPEHDLNELVERCKGLKPIRTGVVHPCTTDALLGAAEAVDHGLIEAILFGPDAEIRKVASAAKIDLANYRIVATADPEESAAKAAAMAGTGAIHALMKGSLHTDQYMHAVLTKENNLRTGRLLSHCMLIAAPTYSRRIILSDVAVNIAPDVDQKKDIIQNAIILAQAIGIPEPKVALLSAVELVRTKMPSTMEAAALAKMADRRQIVGGIVDGPLDLDIAVDAQSARTKGVSSPVAGVADILIAPDIDAGNMMYKELSFMGKAQVAGIVMGAKVPVILTSRSDSAEARLFSTALAAIFADATAKNPSLLHPATSE
ncbi:MAG: bifunctional enoyl-CoA hydratase/phosphate acetyltransferase [Methylocella sp.]